MGVPGSGCVLEEMQLLCAGAVRAEEMQQVFAVFANGDLYGSRFECLGRKRTGATVGIEQGYVALHWKLSGGQSVSREIP